MNIALFGMIAQMVLTRVRADTVVRMSVKDGPQDDHEDIFLLSRKTFSLNHVDHIIEWTFTAVWPWISRPPPLLFFCV